ncbi:MAG: magnesium transporter [Rickettsiaceae bacterium]
MTNNSLNLTSILETLNKIFLLEFPMEAARRIETMLPKSALVIFNKYGADVLLPVWKNLNPSVTETLLLKCPSELATFLLTGMDTISCAALIGRFETKQQESILSLLKESDKNKVRELLNYSDDCAGRLMDFKIISFNENITVGEAILQLKERKAKAFHYLFTLNDNLQLSGQVDMQDIALSDDKITLASIANNASVVSNILEPKNDVLAKIQKFKINTLPVVDINYRLVGIIHESKVIRDLEESVVGDIQTMVGASKDERALSSVLFKVKKRQPWLQINLITAFLAAAVVGLFENIIAEYTALAILLPVVAGQSGNAGAQALAVTMRGLTLREITTKQWLHITIKECAAALINGVVISFSCGIYVFLWSKSLGLAFVISLAMILSMIMAATAGALVPIVLKKLGQDPALSSSIILSTITDIAGFMAFLGIATIFASII